MDATCRGINHMHVSAKMPSFQSAVLTSLCSPSFLKKDQRASVYKMQGLNETAQETDDGTLKKKNPRSMH